MCCSMAFRPWSANVIWPMAEGKDGQVTLWSRRLRCLYSASPRYVWILPIVDFRRRNMDSRRRMGSAPLLHFSHFLPFNEISASLHLLSIGQHSFLGLDAGIISLLQHFERSKLWRIFRRLKVPSVEVPLMFDQLSLRFLSLEFANLCFMLASSFCSLALTNFSSWSHSVAS